MALTDKQQAFVEYYLSTWNATEAALLAGYSEKSARFIASENLSKPNIREAIDQRLSELKMTADEVLVRLAEHARGVPADCFRTSSTQAAVDFEKLRDRGLLHLVKKLSYDTSGNPRVEFYDAQSALVQIGKAHGLFADRVEHSGPDGGALTVRVVYDDAPPLTSTDDAE